jgi:hypothetical protein
MGPTVHRQIAILFALAVGLALFGVQNRAVAGFLDPARSTGPGISTSFHDDGIAEGALSGGVGQPDDANSPSLASQCNDQLANCYDWLLPSAFTGTQSQQTQGGCGDAGNGSYSSSAGQQLGYYSSPPPHTTEQAGRLFLAEDSKRPPPFPSRLFRPPRVG